MWNWCLCLISIQSLKEWNTAWIINVMIQLILLHVRLISALHIYCSTELLGEGNITMPCSLDGHTSCFRGIVNLNVLRLLRLDQWPSLMCWTIGVKSTVTSLGIRSQLFSCLIFTPKNNIKYYGANCICYCTLINCLILIWDIGIISLLILRDVAPLLSMIVHFIAVKSCIAQFKVILKSSQAVPCAYLVVILSCYILSELLS